MKRRTFLERLGFVATVPVVAKLAPFPEPPSPPKLVSTLGKTRVVLGDPFGLAAIKREGATITYDPRYVSVDPRGIF